MTAPCYLCGEPSKLEGLCQDCYNKDHPLIEFSTPLSIETCKKCGSVKVPGGWKTITPSTSDDVKEEQVGILLDREIKPLVKGVSLTLEEENRLDRVLHLRVYAVGRSDPSLDEHEEDYPLEIRFKHASCDMCSMMSGGYYEAILQIRADERAVTEEEEAAITALAKERTISAYGKDNKAFILDIMEDKFGFDIFFGSEHLCRRIVEELESLYYADRKDNYKLVSQEKGGKKKYRTTFLLRLPKYVVGDFVEVSGKPCQVLRIGKGGLSCYNLVDGSTFTVSKKSAKWRSVAFIASDSEKRAFTVVTNVYGQPIQVMDSTNYEMHDLDHNENTEGLEHGVTMYLLRHNDKWYIVPIPPKHGK